MPKFNEEDFREKVREILNDYKVLYNNSASGLIDDILARINSGTAVSKAVEQALKSTNFQGAYDDAVVNAVYQAACAGFGVLPSMVTSNSEKTIKNKLLSDSWAPDKMNLSHRIHTLDVRNTVVQTIRSSMQKADAVNKIARNLYDGYNNNESDALERTNEIAGNITELKKLALRAVNGDKKLIEQLIKKADKVDDYARSIRSNNLKAAYNDLLDACLSLKQIAIERATKVALEEKTRYLAERIARTEATRAWFDGYIAERQDDSDIWGYKWVLSSRHSRVPFDQCDVCANMDIGFGKGVYPKNKVPKIPRHPHCMCMLEDVFEWEVENKSKDIDTDGARKYLNSLGKNQKINLFGYDGYKAYEHGGDWQRLLIGWDGFNNPVSRLSNDFKLKSFADGKKLTQYELMSLNLIEPTDEFIKELATKHNLPYTIGKGSEERFYADNGKPIYPPNDGARGNIEIVILKTGQKILTRYGRKTGKFVSPDGTTFEQRSLPRDTDVSDYHKYNVISDLPKVEQGIIASWFNKSGGGIQLKLPYTIKELLEQDIIEEVFDSENK